HDHGPPLRADRLAREVERVQRGALLEQLRLWRVQVLRDAVGRERAAAEADRLAARVAGRGHQAGAEAGADARRAGPIALVQLDHEAGTDEVLGREPRAGQVLAQRGAPVRRVAEREALAGLVGHAAALEVAARRLAGGLLHEQGVEVQRGRL